MVAFEAAPSVRYGRPVFAALDAHALATQLHPQRHARRRCSRRRRRRHHNGQARVDSSENARAQRAQAIFFAARFPQFQTAFSIFQTEFQGLFTDIK